MNINYHSGVDDNTNNMNCAIGIEIGDNQTQCALLREDGNVLFYRAYPKDTDGEMLLISVENVIRQALSFSKEHSLSVAGIGVGVPAIVEDGVVIGATEHLPELFGCDVKKKLLLSFGLPVYIENDAHMVAMAENCYGSAITSSNVVFLTVGSGIGGALKLNGHLYSGNRNRGGELGHMIINSGGMECECGGKGCLQAYASIDALLKHYCELAKIKHSEITQEVFLEAYEQQTESALSAMNWHIKYLSEGIASLINCLAPEKVIVNCQFNEIGDFYINALKEHVLSVSLPAASENVVFSAGFFGKKSGCIGAATMVFVN